MSLPILGIQVGYFNIENRVDMLTANNGRQKISNSLGTTPCFDEMSNDRRGAKLRKIWLGERICDCAGHTDRYLYVSNSKSLSTQVFSI